MGVPLFSIYLFPHLLSSAYVHSLLFVRVCMSLLCIVSHIHMECCHKPSELHCNLGFALLGCQPYAQPLAILEVQCVSFVCNLVLDLSGMGDPPVLIDQNFCGIGIEHRALQSPKRRINV